MLKSKVVFDVTDKIDHVDERIYGSFIEHLGRAVYDGIYEPTHPLADEAGFRKDVIEAVRALKVPIIRYPGGNFVSGYNWEDGVGPKESRPRRLELAWKSIETNEVGVHEFNDWCEKVGSEVLMAVNLGSRGPEEARRLVEYCIFPEGTQLSDWRIQNGRKQPFAIRTWCLGNEMDGEWQIGHKQARDYGKVAQEASKLIKMIDEKAEVVVCGSSSREICTFGTWEREVLDECYELADYVSLHQYYEPKRADYDHRSYLTLAEHMASFIEEVTQICDEVGASKGSKKKLNLSMDEWNVWYLQEKSGEYVEPWQVAPHLLEDVYTARDAVLFATLMNTLINHCDRVKIACLAQLVNVIAPIATEHGGRMCKQSTYYPYYYASVYGRGDALRPHIDCPTYDCKCFQGVNSIHVSGVKNGSELFVMLVNRSNGDEDVTVELKGAKVKSVTEYTTLHHDNPLAVNNFDNPDEITPQPATARLDNGTLTFTAKEDSVHFLRLTIEE